MKIAFSGTHGCGKTTAAFKEVYNSKLDNPGKIVNILTEVARECPFPINKETTVRAQTWIFLKQFIRELEEEPKCDILICDRTIIDVLSYCLCVGFDRLVDILYPIASDHLKTYDKIYFLSLQNNDYHFSDGIRDRDSKFRIDVENKLLNIYNELGKNISNWNNIFIIK